MREVASAKSVTVQEFDMAYNPAESVTFPEWMYYRHWKSRPFRILARLESRILSVGCYLVAKGAFFEDLKFIG